jgi:hypothetical protein
VFVSATNRLGDLCAEHPLSHPSASGNPILTVMALKKTSWAKA